MFCIIEENPENFYPSVWKEKWKNNVLKNSYTDYVQQEIRFFVIDGKIVTHSTYKINHKLRVFEDIMTDPQAIEFVKRVIEDWIPDKAFVLDVALFNEEYKILKLGHINNAETYRSDVNKIVDALDQIKI